ncbi:hypothetical protein AGMMS50267_11670 [Spirochaetia bacterium]|nr:hypothetical protein AGMMS50267_11670 [Spirochaetia bacterium]
MRFPVLMSGEFILTPKAEKYAPINAVRGWQRKYRLSDFGARNAGGAGASPSMRFPIYILGGEFTLADKAKKHVSINATRGGMKNTG